MTSAAAVEFVYARTNAVSVRGNNEAKILHDRIDTTPFESVTDASNRFRWSSLGTTR